jgi:hypothetical protein
MRLELGEIETAILNFPGILQATVIMREAHQNKQIHAFCTLQKGVEQPKVKDVEEFLLQRLQRHAIPSSILFLEELPRTATGKINRRILQDMNSTQIVTNGDAVTAGNAAEPTESDEMKTVRCIWEEVLGVDPNQLKPTDNFFYNGGNSLLVFQMMEILRKAIPKFSEANPTLLFQFPVLKNFVETLKSGEGLLAPKFTAVDFGTEIQLPADFPQRNLEFKSGTGILITGTTGFLGPFLLMDALKQFDDRDFFCIIRAKSDEAAKNRLDAIFDDYSLRHFLVRPERITCIAGDLTLPKFGLSDALYESLLSKVGIIFHSAAEVSFMKQYEQLKRSTVAMNINMLRFAMEGTISSCHF